MYLPKSASRRRQLEAEAARNNRLEIVKARSHGQITRRDLFKWGIFTTSGLLLCKNGLSPFAPSAYGAVPTGTPRSPLFGARKFTQRMPRLDVQKPIPPDARDPLASYAKYPVAMNEYASGLSYHTEYTANPADPTYCNPLTGHGPCDGRPPGPCLPISAGTNSTPRSATCMSLGSGGGQHTSPSELPGTEIPTPCGATAAAGSSGYPHAAAR